MRILTRDDIQAANDLKKEWVPIPEWQAPGDTEEAGVFVRALSSMERDDYEAGIINREIKSVGRRTEVDLHFNDSYFVNLKARLCVRCMCDEDGNRLFSDDDAEMLGKKSAAALNRVADVAQRLSAMTNEEIEQLGKASESGPSSALPTGSPSQPASITSINSSKSLARTK